MREMEKIKIPMTEKAFFQMLGMLIIIAIVFIIAFIMQPPTYGWF